ncbi:hypothetical protein ACSSS7_003889 [Eimeria intestinalis]
MVAAAEDAADEGRAFAELEELLSQEEFDQAFKAASQLPVSIEQTHAVVYTSLQTRRWAEARAAIRKLRQHLQQQQQKSPTAAAAAAAGTAAAAPAEFGLEEAYCLYRLNNPQKALQLLGELQQQKLRPQDEAAATHLHAQVLHRCGHYREAFDIYTRLLVGSSKQDKEVLLLLSPLFACFLSRAAVLRPHTQCTHTRSTTQLQTAAAAAAAAPDTKSAVHCGSSRCCYLLLLLAAAATCCCCFLLLLAAAAVCCCCLKCRPFASYSLWFADIQDLLVSNYLACMTCMLQSEAASCSRSGSSSSSSSSGKDKPHPPAVSAALQNDCSSSGTFELPFNAACLAMQKGDLERADALLHRSIGRLLLRQQSLLMLLMQQQPLSMPLLRAATAADAAAAHKNSCLSSFDCGRLCCRCLSRRAVAAAVAAAVAGCICFSLGLWCLARPRVQVLLCLAAACVLAAAELCAAEEGVSLADAFGCLEGGHPGEFAGLLVQQAVLQQQRGHAAAAERVYSTLQSAVEQQQQQQHQQQHEQQHEQQQQQQQQQVDVGVVAVAITNRDVLCLQRRQRFAAASAAAAAAAAAVAFLCVVLLHARLVLLWRLCLSNEMLLHAAAAAAAAAAVAVAVLALGVGVVRCLGLLQAGRTEEAFRVVSSLSSRLGSSVGLERLKATIQFVSGKIGKAEQTLRVLVETAIPDYQGLDSPRFDLQLALAALLLQKGDRAQASALLREVQQQLFKLAQQKRSSSSSDSSSDSSSSSSRYLTLLGAAFELQQQIEGIDGVFESLQLQTALEGVQGLAAVSASVEFSLAAAALAASVGRWEFAAAQSEQALQRLQQQQQQQQQDGEAAAAAELRALVSLAEGLCRFDLEKAGVYVQRLMRFTPQSVSLLDADEIEARSLPATRSRKTAAVAAAAAAAATGGGGKTGKRRRRKKIRYPKGFDPSKPQLPPDPESSNSCSNSCNSCSNSCSSSSSSRSRSSSSRRSSSSSSSSDSSSRISNSSTSNSSSSSSTSSSSSSSSSNHGEVHCLLRSLQEWL